MIVVERAPPYLTIQDLGRQGMRASGVPACGAMDQWSLEIANVLVGNDRGAAAFEWAIAGGSLRFETDCFIALTGADVEATLDGAPIHRDSSVAVSAGAVLEVKRFLRWRFLYVAVAGGIDAPEVLGSRSTYVPAGFGGIEGRRLKNGDCVIAGKSRFVRETIRVLSGGPDFSSNVIRFVSRSDSLPDESEFTISAASDRMGYRLERANDATINGASITSEPVCAGTIQLPPDGQPIVLMADSPTVGGYGIGGAVASADLPILAQCMPGARIVLQRTTIEEAQAALREREEILSSLTE